MNRIDATPRVTRADTGQQSRLRQIASRFEGVFVEQLFKAMRETVPTDGALDGGGGEDLFTSMLDQQVADSAPARWHRGLSSAIVKTFGPRVASPPEAR